MNCSSVSDFKNQQKSGKWNNGESSNLRSTFPYIVKLAPESPSNKPAEAYDESSYDSFHNWETDYCKDSTDDDYSDSDSSKTTGYAVMDVVEYEVPSSNDDDDETLSTISSGTDEFAFEAATAAFYEFNALVNENMSDADSDEFIFADTESDTEGSIDLELGQADYWKCVKCNNKQNNPLYRYCEKCYQVRKSLFPPRPKRLKKSRTETSRKRKMAQQNQEYTSTEIESDSDLECPATKKLVLSTREECVNTVSKNGNQLKENKLSNESSKHANSAGELSCNNSSSDDVDDGEIELNSIKKRDVLTKIKVSPSSSIEIAKVASYPSTSVIKVESSHRDDDYLEFKVENKLIQSVYRQELTCSKRFQTPKSLEWKDSGLSSCQESSQEFLSSPSDEGFLIRSSSSTSTRSFDSQSDFPLSQASTQLPHDSEDETDSEGILTRVEEFTQERQEKMKQDSSTRPANSETTVSDDPASDINDSNLGMCRFCMVNPKNGVFVHSNCLHLCCCYKCAIKVWKKRKSCPICNCKIKNVTKLFVH